MKLPKNLETAIKKEIREKSIERKKEKQEWKREYERAKITYNLLEEVASLPLIKRYTQKIRFLPIKNYTLALKEGKVWKIRNTGFWLEFNPINLRKEEIAFLSMLGNLNQELVLKILSFHISPNWRGEEYEKIRGYL